MYSGYDWSVGRSPECQMAHLHTYLSLAGTVQAYVHRDRRLVGLPAFVCRRVGSPAGVHQNAAVVARAGRASGTRIEEGTTKGARFERELRVVTGSSNRGTIDRTRFVEKR